MATTQRLVAGQTGEADDQVVAELAGLAPGHARAAMQDQQLVGGFDLVQQVGGPQHAQALLATQIAHMSAQRQAAGRVEPGAGFVEQQQARLVEQGAGNLHAAAVAAVERAHLVVTTLG
ncbi:hypothetical protein PSOLE_37770 [Pseudomonas oleovorans subsp. oleovorans]|uniref:Uncharacterized protein n=1 Tax=Ectopseudomonas oleovorans TaxID=301 RepID=A0A379JXS0_ECTOL|nr:hypothetical protein PSOLE_37770 [Pseudomonas oleovorans subsp. oleovorans]SEJ66909.1 hypothetical protein SAMN05216280_103517 [Pseudomonas oleovorans]SUD53146.1 Uncharacterised protein [Pseudomonas oleovorans]